MFKNRFFRYLLALGVLSGCTTGGDKSSTSATDWFSEYDAMTTGTPVQMLYGTQSDGYGTDLSTSDTYNMAVLLPLSGTNASVGRTIRTSVEAAILQNAPKNLSVSFYDTNDNLSEQMPTILATQPEVILGPVFSADTRLVKQSRTSDIPVLSFTSDATVLGDGVMTMALMPTNGIETIIQEMQIDGVQNFIVMAPDTDSGHLMAGAAKSASEIYNIPLSGIFYYKEKDTDSIKSAALSASMNNARTSAHTRARQVLSDILINEKLTSLEKSNLDRQLTKLSRTETLGPVPYNAILFLGGGDDTQALTSFLRYYNVGASDARLYGTTMWEGSNIASDFTMSGAKYATMPDTDPTFSNTYSLISGTLPNRLATFGYDATNFAIGMIYSNKSTAAYLLNPSGYLGTDGLFRIHPNGASERALRIVELDASGTPRLVKDAPNNFLEPLYNIQQNHITPAPSMELQTSGIDPDNYITIPDRYRFKYRSKTLGANTTSVPVVQKSELITIMPEEDGDTIRAENYTPVKLERVGRSYIEEYEIYE